MLCEHYTRKVVGLGNITQISLITHYYFLFLKKWANPGPFLLIFR